MKRKGGSGKGHWDLRDLRKHQMEVKKKDWNGDYIWWTGKRVESVCYERENSCARLLKESAEREERLLSERSKTTKHQRKGGERERKE